MSFRVFTMIPMWGSICLGYPLATLPLHMIGMFFTMRSKILTASDWPKWSLLNTLSAYIVQFFMFMGKRGGGG